MEKPHNSEKPSQKIEGEVNKEEELPLHERICNEYINDMKMKLNTEKDPKRREEIEAEIEEIKTNRKIIEALLKMPYEKKLSINAIAISLVTCEWYLNLVKEKKKILEKDLSPIEEKRLELIHEQEILLRRGYGVVNKTILDQAIADRALRETEEINKNIEKLVFEEGKLREKLGEVKEEIEKIKGSVKRVVGAPISGVWIELAKNTINKMKNDEISKAIKEIIGSEVEKNETNST